MNMNLKRGYTYFDLERLGIYYNYDDLIDLEERRRFPKQVMHKIWDAEEVLAWLLANIYRLPPKLD